MRVFKHSPVAAIFATFVLSGCPNSPAPKSAADGGSALIDASRRGTSVGHDAAADGSITSTAGSSGSQCSTLQHSCPCATGSYCLQAGAACLTPSSPCPGHADAGTHDSGAADGGLTCTGFQHVCSCATGAYCLAGNAACINPGSPCPVHADAGAADAGTTCGPLQHACACATGSYCLAAGAACIAPSSPCP